MLGRDRPAGGAGGVGSADAMDSADAVRAARCDPHVRRGAAVRQRRRALARLLLRQKVRRSAAAAGLSEGQVLMGREARRRCDELRKPRALYRRPHLFPQEPNSSLNITLMMLLDYCIHDMNIKHKVLVQHSCATKS